MKVLLLTDIHGETEKLEKIIEKEEYDAVLCAGDLSDANEYSQYGKNCMKYLRPLKTLEKCRKPFPETWTVKRNAYRL